jgi:hypothetical protein
MLAANTVPTEQTARRCLTPKLGSGVDPNHIIYREGKSELGCAKQIANSLSKNFAALTSANLDTAPDIISRLSDQVVTGARSAFVLVDEGNFGMNNGIKRVIRDLASSLATLGENLAAAKTTPNLRPLELKLVQDSVSAAQKAIDAVGRFHD